MAGEEMALANLEIHAIIRELDWIKGKFFEKQADLATEEDYAYKMKVVGGELIATPTLFYSSKYTKQAAPPKKLAQFVRKHFKGKKIQSIEQPGFDRVVKIVFDDRALVFELFGSGNIIAIDADGAIISCERNEEWKDRKIRQGEDYSLPASAALDPRNMSESAFNDIFTKKDVIRSLAAGVKFGPKYLEEACLRTGVDKNAEKVTAEQAKALFTTIKAMLDENKPGIQGLPVVFPLQSDEQFMEKASFNEAVDDFYSGKVVVIQGDTGRVERQIAQQEKALEKFELLERESKEKAELIYLKYNEIDGVLTKVRELIAKKASEAEINEFLGSKGSYSGKTKRLSLEL